MKHFCVPKQNQCCANNHAGRNLIRLLLCFKDVIFNLIFRHFYEKAKTASLRTWMFFSKLDFQNISPFHHLRRPYLSLTLAYCFPLKKN